MTLDEICENARQLCATHGWDQTDVSARMLHVTSEVGEVADAVIAWHHAGPESIEAAKSALGYEIFDAIWNLCALANAVEVDIAKAAQEKVSINTERVWPVE